MFKIHPSRVSVAIFLLLVVTFLGITTTFSYARKSENHQHHQKQEKPKHRDTVPRVEQLNEENNNEAFFSQLKDHANIQSQREQRFRQHRKKLFEKYSAGLFVNSETNKQEKVGDPWSWSGSSWSFSDSSSSSSSSASSWSSSSTSSSWSWSSSSSGSGPTTTTTPAPSSPPTTPSPASSSSASSSSSSNPSSSGSSSSSSYNPEQGHKFHIYNNCTESIYVAILSNPGFALVADGGFVMARAGPPVEIFVPIGWQGRIWARIGCKFNVSGFCNPPYQPCCLSGSCLTAEGAFGLKCAHSGIAPTSLIEFSLDNKSPQGPYDVYDVSLVDGWSVPLSIQPVRHFRKDPIPGVKAPWCKMSGCDAAPACPPSLAVAGTSLSCFSPCQAAVNNKSRLSSHDLDRSCCVCTQSHPRCNCASSTTWGSFYFNCCNNSFGCTPYHTPLYPADQVCDPWSTAPGRGWSADGKAYIKTVRDACKRSYSWQFDDTLATFNCAPEKLESGEYAAVDYRVVFVTRFR